MRQGAFMLPHAALELGNPTATAIPAERSNSRVNITMQRVSIRLKRYRNGTAAIC
jgi:hypothetical protein